MTWTGARELRAQAARLWERGELGRQVIAGADAFPLRLVLKGPGSADLSDRFEAVRAWAAAVAATPRVRLVWREVRHRVQGLQRLPAQVWVDTLDDALALAGRERDAARLRRLGEVTAATRPELLPWLARRPLQALELEPDWPRLLAVVGWLCAHPRPGCHLRQVDVPGVHSKFIESHRGVLAELFDLALPPSAIRAEATGTGRFAERYGFLGKPVRLRLRVLDTRLALLPGVGGHPDITLDAASFAALSIPARRVFITENETNFLAFPPVPDSLVLFGAGYGWEALARARWLAALELHYWGDIDTHGFAILDRLRGHFPAVRSFLMDRDTLLAHEAQWGDEPEPTTADLQRLTGEESALYDALRDNRIRPRLRLEQERVGFNWLLRALERLL